MGGDHRLAPTAALGALAGLLLAACATSPPSPAHAQTGYDRGQAESAGPPQAPAAPMPEGPAYAPPPAAVSYPRYGDSDDYLCNFAPPGDPRSLAACIRLHGAEALPPLHSPRWGDSDDFLCNHGVPADPRTSDACGKLRPPEP